MIIKCKTLASVSQVAIMKPQRRLPNTHCGPKPINSMDLWLAAGAGAGGQESIRQSQWQLFCKQQMVNMQSANICIPKPAGEQQLPYKMRND